MEKKIPFTLTHEKHLDHMVRVVPLIVLGFAIQSYILLQMNSSIGTASIMFLGVCLAFMIGGFVLYDLKHQVNFYHDHLKIEFLFYQKTLVYSEITQVEVSESKQTFARLIIRTQRGKNTIFFVDEAELIKNFLLSQNQTLEVAA